MNKRIFAAFAMGVFRLTASAVTFIGKDSSGSGDLAEPTHWEGGAVPTSEVTVFNQAGTLNASAEKNFTGTSTITATGPLVFDLANPVSFDVINNTQDGARIVVTNGTALSLGTKLDLSVTSGMKGGSRLTDVSWQS